MSGPFDLPPDPFDDELDRLLPPLPEPPPQPKPNGEDNTGMQWGQRDVVRFCRDIDDIATFKAGIELARAMLTEGFVFEGDITIELIRAARRSGISEKEIARQIDSLYNWHPSEDEEEQEREALPTINASSFAGKAIPIRQYLDGFDFFIKDDASFLTGAGAIGKTLVILQLAAAVAYPVDAIAQTNWLGNAVKVRGKVLFYSGEEDSDELHRRLDDICAHEGFDLDRLGDLMICDMAAEEEKALLRPHDKHRDMLVKTSLFASLEKSMEAEKPALLIIDNKAQIIKGNEMSRDVATDVVNIFRALAKRHGCTVVILAHPSMSGIAQKTGASGSTGWINTTRGQVNMRHPDDEQEGPDDGRRILVAQKANYSRQGRVVNVVWDMGCYRCTDKPERAGTDIGRADRAERVFLKLMKSYEQRGIELSAVASSQTTYAPTLFFKDASREGVNKREFERAMFVLLDKGIIKNIVVNEGKYREKRRLVLVC